MRLFQAALNFIILKTLIIVILIFSGCSQSVERSGTDQNPDFINSSWITDGREWPVDDSLMYGEFPSPLFRKEFRVSQDIRSAKLFITAAGYYSATINGDIIGKNFLDPAWTNFAKRIYYSEYDITSSVKQGINCIGLTLGNGFYNPLPMRFWSSHNLRDFLPVGKPAFIAKLKIIYGNGDIEEVNTNSSWKFSYGPIVKNNIYLGEVYNAAKEIDGWNLTGFDDSGWKKSIKNNGPGGKLEKTFFPPIQITGEHKPVAVLSPEPGIYIIDMGVNFSGIYSIRLKGQKGDTITFRFGERLYENGTLNTMTAVAGQIKRTGSGNSETQETEWHADNGPGCPPVAWQTDKYIFGDKTDVWYRPTFTFHLYRYIEISGLRYEPEYEDLTGLALNSNVENENNFTCSSELINSIQKATRRTFLDNLIGVQSDCPGRERFGYGGDLNATAESFIYNFDMQSFYRKTIFDWVDAMQDSIFIDTAPYVGIKICGLSWESAFLITQYKMLIFYNDVEIIKELYKLDLEWMEKAARFHPSGIVDKGLSDHESLIKVPVELIGTTLYLDCARIMKRFASIMNDPGNEEKFEKLANKLSETVLEKYWRKSVPDTINRQTLFSTLLYYNIIPENEKKAAVDSLLKALKKGPSAHFTTGIFGTKYILEALSETGNTGSVFDVVNSTSYPGWGFMIDRGATTIWETWKESDNIYSNCHPMFGSVSEWFYRRLAGIQPDPENPGFKRFIISPYLPADISYVNCTYRSPFGTIRSDWKKSKTGVEFEINIPESTSASFFIPLKKNTIVSVENVATGRVFTQKVLEQDFKIDLQGGNYLIAY